MNHAVNKVLRHARIVGLPSVVGMVLAGGCCSWRQGLAVRRRQSDMVIAQHVREEEQDDVQYSCVGGLCQVVIRAVRCLLN